MGLPFFLINLNIRVSIEKLRFCTLSGSISYHAYAIENLSSSRYEYSQLFSQTLQIIMHHTFSIDLVSRLQGGHSRTWICCELNQCIVMSVLCIWAFFFWNTHGLPAKSSENYIRLAECLYAWFGCLASI